MKTKRWSRTPTQAELAAFTGMHCSKKYRTAVATGWRCPSCGRSAPELVRWSEIRGPTWGVRYGDEHGMGFTISMADHHCHAASRFPTTLICGDCNSADGAAKRKLGLPSDWSYSPAELARIVGVKPHSGKTTINYERAKQIYDDAQGLWWPKPSLGSAGQAGG